MTNYVEMDDYNIQTKKLEICTCKRYTRSVQ